MLTREKLARALGVSPKTITQWVGDGVIPQTFCTLTGAGIRATQAFSPRTMTVGVLMIELGEVFGSDNSPLPKRIAKALVNELDRIAWDDTRDRRLTVECGRFTIIAATSFLRIAKEKLQALDAA